MIGCLRTRVRKRPISALYFESEFYNLKAKYMNKLTPKVVVAATFLMETYTYFPTKLKLRPIILQWYMHRSLKFDPFITS